MPILYTLRLTSVRLYSSRGACATKRNKMVWAELYLRQNQIWLWAWVLLHCYCEMQNVLYHVHCFSVRLCCKKHKEITETNSQHAILLAWTPSDVLGDLIVQMQGRVWLVSQTEESHWLIAWMCASSNTGRREYGGKKKRKGETSGHKRNRKGIKLLIITSIYICYWVWGYKFIICQISP